MDEGRGSCVLRETDNAEILCRCLLKFDGERYLIHSYVVMPNHAHILFSLAEGQTLEDVVGAWKRYSAIGSTCAWAVMALFGKGITSTA